MFGWKSINGSVEWLGNPSNLRNDGPPWTLNPLAPTAVGEEEVPVPVITLVVVLGGIQTVFLSNGIGLLASFQFITG